MNGSNRISVLVVHEDPVMAAGLGTLLREAVDLDVSVRAAGAPAQDSDDTPAHADVVVADYRSGVALMERATVATPGQGIRLPKVMILSAMDREADVRSAMRAGVRGYVVQGAPIEELINGVRLLARGSRYLCDTVAERIADSLTREDLTSRETEVLHLLTRGMANKVIARQLGIAVGTVKTHVKGILEKLDARTRTHAVAIATERGLVSVGARQVPGTTSVMVGTATTERHSYA